MEGNAVSIDFRPDDKAAAVRCWQQTLARSGVDDRVLAAELGMSSGHFSKISTGVQGDLLGLIFRVGARRPELRRDFVARLAEREHVDPKVVAAEDLVITAMRFLKLCGAAAVGGA